MSRSSVYLFSLYCTIDQKAYTVGLLCPAHTISCQQSIKSTLHFPAGSRITVTVMNSALTWLDSTECPLQMADIVRNKARLISIDEGLTLTAALDVMSEYRISAVAIHRAARDSTGGSLIAEDLSPPVEYVAIITITDLLAYCHKSGGKFDALIAHVLRKTPNARAFVAADIADPICSYLKEFSSGETFYGLSSIRCRTDFKMLSQSDFVSFLISYEEDLPEINKRMNVSIDSLCSSTSSFVYEDSSVKSALDLLLSHHAIPVICRSTGAIVETFSVSDLTGPSNLAAALLDTSSTVALFMSRIQVGVLRKQISLDGSSTIRDAARLMIQSGIHRVWIDRVRADFLPQVLSMTDILAFMSDSDIL